VGAEPFRHAPEPSSNANPVSRTPKRTNLACFASEVPTEERLSCSPAPTRALGSTRARLSAARGCRAWLLSAQPVMNHSSSFLHEITRPRSLGAGWPEVSSLALENPPSRAPKCIPQRAGGLVYVPPRLLLRVGGEEPFPKGLSSRRAQKRSVPSGTSFLLAGKRKKSLL